MVADMLRSVVLEEMTHMGLAANLLNAVGGSPVIARPGFVPAYPGPLPGTVGGDLEARLDRLSLDLVENVFMRIEEPEDPLVFRSESAAETGPLTIGEFYAAIADQLRTVGSAAFVGDPARQVTHELGQEGLIAITDLDSALAAIHTIVEEGEGTQQSPLDREGELAHYYRFAEIKHGHRLVPIPDAPPDAPPDQLFSYTGSTGRDRGRRRPAAAPRPAAPPLPDGVGGRPRQPDVQLHLHRGAQGPARHLQRPARPLPPHGRTDGVGQADRARDGSTAGRSDLSRTATGPVRASPGSRSSPGQRDFDLRDAGGQIDLRTDDEAVQEGHRDLVLPGHRRTQHERPVRAGHSGDVGQVDRSGGEAHRRAGHRAGLVLDQAADQRHRRPRRPHAGPDLRPSTHELRDPDHGAGVRGPRRWPWALTMGSSSL